MSSHAFEDSFEEAIYTNWATYFGCSTEHLTQPGTDLLPDERFRGSGELYLWRIGHHAFLQIDPALTALLEHLSQALQTPVTLTGEAIRTSAHDYPLSITASDVLCYLEPNAFRPVEAEVPFRSQQLTLADRAALERLHTACSEDDVDNAYVEIDHDTVWGVWHDRDVVAAASMYGTRSGFHDIGVLTHPAFRGRQLGKVVVSALCSYALAQDALVQYRCHEDLWSSLRLAQALGFRKYFQQQTLALH